MHELSIAVNIVEMIESNAEKEKAHNVDKFEIDVPYNLAVYNIVKFLESRHSR